MNVITFDKLLAWRHCPMGASAGYIPRKPLGDTNTVRAVLMEWPEKTKTLDTLTGQMRKTVKWFHETGFAMCESTPWPPPTPKSEDDYWVNLTGHLHRETIMDEEVEIRFEVPYLHRPGGDWEIVFMDTHGTAPTEHEWSDIVKQISFVRACFETMTGEVVHARFLAPMYERELHVNIPRQNIVKSLSLLNIINALAYIDPGPYCRQTVQEGRRKRTFRCPLREAGECHGTSEAVPHPIAH